MTTLSCRHCRHDVAASKCCFSDAGPICLACALQQVLGSPEQEKDGSRSWSAPLNWLRRAD